MSEGIFAHVTAFVTVIKRKGTIFRGDNYFEIILPPSAKGSTQKGKNLLPFGAVLFLLE